MEPAAAEMDAVLAEVSVEPLRVPLVANVTARPVVGDWNELKWDIRRLLVEQVTGRVRWRESMEWMAGEGGVTRFAEIGSGKVLAGMARRIAPDAESVSLNTPEDLEAFAKSF
jgi:[acyl-carrier-protein] S-malonyltransferase